MRAVCIDALNPNNAPSVKRLKNLYADIGVRDVLRQNPAFLSYHVGLARAGIPLSVVYTNVSAEWGSLVGYADWLSDVEIEPVQYLVGNEPNAVPGSVSSDAMSNTSYRDIWNQNVPALKSQHPTAQAWIGGMLGMPDGYLDAIWQDLDPRPDGIDVHYPENRDVLNAWLSYGVPISCMELNYEGRGVKPEDVSAYIQMVDSLCWGISWFDWGYDLSMSLVGSTGKTLKAFRMYKAALASLNTL